VDPDAARRETAAQMGLADVRAAVPVDDDELAGTVSLVLECSAHEQAVLDGLAVLEKRGELVLVGVPMVRKTEIYAQEIMNKAFRAVATIRSGSEWEVPKYPTDYRKNSNFGNMAAALRWLAEGSVAVEGLYMVAAPDDPQTIYQDLLHQRTARPAVVLDWTV
jgi:threonine dehydrogenase-like Zn-dependent dehydrogenase